MGIIRAVTGAIGGALADQWEEVIEAGNMSDTTVMAPGVKVRAKDRRNQNTRGTADLISNGSVIHVGQNQFMMLVDGGKVIDYSAEPGYFQVTNTSVPSLFNGEFKEALQETFDRVRFGGVSPQQQKVYFINLQEIKNIAFGTTNPVNYFDNFYNAELYLRAYGYFSIRITDPLLFYAEAIPRNQDHVEITDIHKLYLAEFLTAFQSAINQMSVDGIRISHVASKGTELAKYMSEILDEDWTQKRGMRIESVGISSISYDEDSKELINLRNKGAMLSDAAVREGYVQGSIARGLEAAGSNANGSMAGFMGVGMGMQSAGNFMASASQTNQYQMEQAAKQRQEQAVSPDTWTCSCGQKNTGKFCSNCGKEKPQAPQEWICSCGQKNMGNFCSNCGKPMPQEQTCPKCGAKVTSEQKFCQNCGEKLH